jgi:hypothetical protein
MIGLRHLGNHQRVAPIGDYGVVFPPRLTVIRGTWEDMAGVPVSFSLVLRVVVSARSRVCPPGLGVPGRDR